MTRFERIADTPDSLANFILKIGCNIRLREGGCPPEPWPCMIDVDESCMTCIGCWRRWLEAEVEDGK